MINPFNDCVYDKGRWKIYRHFSRVIAETVKRIKNK